jgi:hypothetical protein
MVVELRALLVGRVKSMKDGLDNKITLYLRSKADKSLASFILSVIITNNDKTLFINMKHLVLIFLIVTSSTFVSSQANAYRDFIIAASSKTNPTMVSENFKQVGGSARFFSDNWSDGYVYPNFGEVISKGTKFNYDFDENTLYLQSDKKEIIAINMVTVKKFGIVNNKGETVHFGKVKGLDNGNPIFYEIIGGSDTTAIAIYKTRKVEYVKPDKNDYLRNFNGDYTGTYRSTSDYYLYDQSKPAKKIKSLSKREMLNFFPNYKDKIFQAFKSKKNLSDKEAKLLIDQMLSNTSA